MGEGVAVEVGMVEAAAVCMVEAVAEGMVEAASVAVGTGEDEGFGDDDAFLGPYFA